MKNVIIAFALLLTTLTIQAQNTPMDLDIRAVLKITDNGNFVTLGEHQYEGYIANEKGVYVEVYLQAGKVYLFTSASDEDVADMDMFLWRGDTKISEDISLGSEPHIIYEPTVSGTYTVYLQMVDCKTYLCKYGFYAFVGNF